jgi:hypothetical protein
MVANTTHTPSELDVQIIQGEAPTIYIYRVDAGELQKLTSDSNPLPLGFAGVAIGAFFSLLPTVNEGMSKLGTADFKSSDFVYALIDLIALFIGIALGALAIRNARSVKSILEKIKRRAE